MVDVNVTGLLVLRPRGAPAPARAPPSGGRGGSPTWSTSARWPAAWPAAAAASTTRPSTASARSASRCARRSRPPRARVADRAGRGRRPSWPPTTGPRSASGSGPLRRHRADGGRGHRRRDRLHRHPSAADGDQRDADPADRAGAITGSYFHERSRTLERVMGRDRPCALRTRRSLARKTRHRRLRDDRGRPRRRRRRPRRSPALGALPRLRTGSAAPSPSIATSSPSSNGCADRVRVVGIWTSWRRRRSWSRRWSRTPSTRARCWRSWPRIRARRDRGHHHLVAVDRGSGPGQRAPGPVRGAARVQSGPADGARGARLPARDRDDVRARPRPVRDLGKTPVEVPDTPGSWSTGCCSPTCSAP